jgi:phage major head subunit gpT-like protein
MLPALDTLIFQKFDPYPPQFSRVFRIMSSTRSIEQTTQLSGLGTFSQIAEGAPMVYDQPVQGFDKTYQHDQFGLGFRATKVMVMNDKFAIVKKMATELGRGARETLELRVADHFNNGFSGSYLGPDSKALFADDHPLVKSGGTQKNELSTPADLDIVSLQLALTDFRKMVDSSGKKARVRPKTLIVPPELEFIASEILSGPHRSDTANRTVNAFRHRDNQFASFNNWHVWDYLTDTDAWFISGDKGETELRFYWREKPNAYHDIDFDTRAIKTAMWFQYSSGWSDFYGIYGSPGA